MHGYRPYVPIVAVSYTHLDVYKRQEPELPHALYGMKLAEKFKEKPDICNAIGAHHDEVEMTCLVYTAHLSQQHLQQFVSAYLSPHHLRQSLF